MTITVNSTCTTITIQSSALNASNISNVLKVRVNESEQIEVAVIPAAASIVFNAASIGVSSLAEGIYEFDLTSTLVDSSIVEDQGCAALVCVLKCQPSTIEMYLNEGDFDKVLALEGLKAASDCSTCGCQTMLNLYNAITNGTTTSTCGCG